MMPRMTEAGVHERTAELRARTTYGWARAAGREQRSRLFRSRHGADPVESALVGLESDLCFLEGIQASRIKSAGSVLGELGERLARLIAPLKSSES